jgi:hypothetical protein
MQPIKDQAEIAEYASRMEKETPFKRAIGLNDNVEFMGKQLHIQTEILQASELSVVTQIFNKGRVIFSKKSECSYNFSGIQNLINNQHAQVLQSLAEKEGRIIGAL